MKNLKKLNSSSILSMSDNLKDLKLEENLARINLKSLGQEIGKEILANFYKKTKSKNAFSRPLSVIVTTKSDAPTFGQGLKESIDPSLLGYMNFEGMRGVEALNTPIREINLPNVGKQNVDFLIIAKPVLATGCTAISLTKTAMNEYNHKVVIIATIFYSIAGINELRADLPNVNIIFVGEPYPIRSNGMLDVDIKLPDEHLKEGKL